MTRHWSKLPPVHRDFVRVPDDDLGRRMVRHKVCGETLPSLGIGYHLQRAPGRCQKIWDERHGVCGAPMTAGPGAGVPTTCSRATPCAVHGRTVEEVRA